MLETSILQTVGRTYRHNLYICRAAMPLKTSCNDMIQKVFCNLFSHIMEDILVRNYFSFFFFQKGADWGLVANE